MPDDFADNLLKGIPRKDFVFGNSVHFAAFSPSGEVVNGWKESSINWEDDDGAVECLLMKEKGGELHFRGGVVRVSRDKVDGIIEHFKVDKEFSYERKPIEGNEYHGNLLFAENIKSELKRTICGALSLIARFV